MEYNNIEIGGSMSTRIPVIALVAACIAFNVTIGSLVYILKLPVYLDSVGIMAAALLVPGSRLNACIFSGVVAILSFITIGLLVSPYEPWYVGTGVAGGIYGSLVVRGRVGDLIDGSASLIRFVVKLALFGLGWAVVAAIMSAPVTVYIFKGVTGAGTTLIFAFLVKTGQQVVNAVLLTGLSAEPIDKTLSLLLAIMMGRFTPPGFRRLLQQPET